MTEREWKKTMPLAILLLLAATAPASAQGICFGGNAVETVTNYYRGYCDNPAGEAGNGTSTVHTLTTTDTYRCQNGGGTSTITRTFYNYVDGPGNSNYDAHDYETCEVTGDYFSCE